MFSFIYSMFVGLLCFSFFFGVCVCCRMVGGLVQRDRFRMFVLELQPLQPQYDIRFKLVVPELL